LWVDWVMDVWVCKYATKRRGGCGGEEGVGNVRVIAGSVLITEFLVIVLGLVVHDEFSTNKIEGV
jgi:hypothetical protein